MRRDNLRNGRRDFFPEVLAIGPEDHTRARQIMAVVDRRLLQG